MRRYAELILRYRMAVIVLTVIASACLGMQIRNLKIVIDPNATLPPQHPYVATTRAIERLFGVRNQIVIGITPRKGDIFTPDVLARVERITAALAARKEVNADTLFSLSAPRAKAIAGTADGIEVTPLMPAVPATSAESEALRAALRANPVYVDALVSRDGRTTAIAVDFRESVAGYQTMVQVVRAIVDAERADGIDIAVGGQPVYLAELERYSERIAFLLPLVIVVVGLIHYEAFRTMQGLILPLVTAVLAVVWALGLMGLARVSMDAFNVTTPILIFAVAAGHAVQILKRYYEEYHHLRAAGVADMWAASRQAVVESLTRVGPVMLTAGIVASLGFLSLLVFDIATIRTFGLFTALGVLSALVLELTFIPALRSVLPPPGAVESRRESEHRLWDRLVDAIADRVIDPRRRRLLYGGWAVLLAICAIGASRVSVDTPLRSYFFENLSFQHEDRILNERLGGTNRLFLLVRGKEEGSIKDPRVMKAMEATQRFLEGRPGVGKTLSVADFVRRINQAMEGDDPAADRVPDERDLIAQYLLLYSMAGTPTDFDTHVDQRYQNASILVLLKSDSTAEAEQLIADLKAFLPTQFGDDVTVEIGGDLAQTAALTETIVREKLWNILQISAVIFVITALFFRSLVAGILVLVPLTMAVIANFGLMGVTGIRLNVATSVISAMVVGLGADYAIYLLYRLREEIGQGADETVAFRRALSTAGKATLFVASAVAGGYGLLVLSWGFNVHIWFAVLIVSAMIVSCLAALTVLPSLVLTFRPRVVFGRGRRQAELGQVAPTR